MTNYKQLIREKRDRFERLKEMFFFNSWIKWSDIIVDYMNWIECKENKRKIRIKINVQRKIQLRRKNKSELLMSDLIWKVSDFQLQ